MNKIGVILMGILFSTVSDAIAKSINTSQLQGIELIDIERQIHSYYHDAWDELMIYISITIAVVGVVVPVVISYLQNKSFKLQNHEMKEKIEEHKKDIFDNAKQLIQEKIEKETFVASKAIEKSLEDNTKKLFENLKTQILSVVDVETKKAFESAQKSLEAKMNDFVTTEINEVRKDIHDSEGKIFHIQSNLNNTNGDHGDALVSLLVAMRSYCKADDIDNFKICLGMLKSRVEAAKPNFSNEAKEAYSRLLKTIKHPRASQKFKNILKEIEDSGDLLK